MNTVFSVTGEGFCCKKKKGGPAQRSSRVGRASWQTTLLTNSRRIGGVFSVTTRLRPSRLMSWSFQYEQVTGAWRFLEMGLREERWTFSSCRLKRYRSQKRLNRGGTVRWSVTRSLNPYASSSARSCVDDRCARLRRHPFLATTDRTRV